MRCANPALVHAQALPATSAAPSPADAFPQPAFEDMDPRAAAAAASIFASNPKLVQMIQGRLGSLIGRSSGYIESLPAPVRRRVSGLKGIQKEHVELEAQFQEEILELEKKYFAKFTPLYERRSAIVNGKVEPTEEEIAAAKDEDEDEDEAEDAAEKEAKPEKETDATEKAAEPVSGIPEFWLSALKNHVSLAEIITDRDEAVLKRLVDIRMEYLEKPGFRLIFEFAENEYFDNKILTKTYFYQSESSYGGDFIYDHAEGDKINWHPGKDLTVRVEAKKQRNKSTPSMNPLYCPVVLANPVLQPPSRLALSAGRSPLSPSSTSSPRPSHPPTTRMRRRRMTS